MTAGATNKPSTALDNRKIADILDQTEDLLEWHGCHRYRIRSYRRDAYAVRNMPIRLAQAVRQDNDLLAIPGIRKVTAKRINEILETGTCKTLQRLLDNTPAGFRALTHIPGVDLSSAIKFFRGM